MFLTPAELEQLPTSISEKLLHAEKIIDSNFFEARDLITQLANDDFVKAHPRLQIVVAAYQTYLLNKDMQYKYCIELCEQIELNPLLQKLPNEKCFLLFNKTTALGFTQQSEKALTISNQNISAANKLAERLQTFVYYRHGYLLYFLGDLKGAVEWLFKSEKAAAIAGNIFLQANCCSILGAVFGNMNELERGLEFSKNAHALFIKFGMPEGEPGNLNNIGDNLVKLDRLDEAHPWFEESYRVAKQQGILQKQIYPLMNLTALFIREEKFDECEKILATAREVSAQIENKNFYNSTLKLESELLLAKNEFAKCAAHIENLLSQDISFDMAHIAQLYHSAYLCYSKLNEPAKALTHFEKFHELDHKMMEEARNKSTQQLAILHEVEIIKKEKQATEEVAQLKSRFLANMSHEIRTPMNAVMGMTNLLLMLNPRADQLSYLEATRKSSENLLTVLNDILDFSKIEKGKIELEEIDFSLEEILEEVNHVMGFKAEEKGLSFSIQSENIFEPVLRGDPVRLYQVLNNICGNAIKFTDKGEINIEVLQERSAENILLKIKVSDTGIGIAEEKQADIFSEFSQAGTSTNRLFGGTGLGLSISKHLVELQGGKISVQSKLNEGTVFEISIPYKIGRADAYEKLLRERNMFDKSVLNNLKILVVDDNALNLTVAVETLRLLNNSVKIDTAENGKDALDKIERNNYQLIIMDGQMPVMDGLTATRLLRASSNKKINALPLIAFTASVLKSEVKEWFDAGADEVLAKPFRIQQLVQVISKVMKRKQNISAVEKNEIEFAYPRILDLCFGDLGKANEMLSNIRKNLAEHIQQLELCKEPIHFDEARRQLHSAQTVLHYLHQDDLAAEMKNFETQIQQNILSSSEIISSINRAIQLLRQV